MTASIRPSQIEEEFVAEITDLAYQALLHHQDGPQLPTGFSGMLPLALVPPLWFAVMNRRLRTPG